MNTNNDILCISLPASFAWNQVASSSRLGWVADLTSFDGSTVDILVRKNSERYNLVVSFLNYAVRCPAGRIGHRAHKACRRALDTLGE